MYHTLCMSQWQLVPLHTIMSNIDLIDPHYTDEEAEEIISKGLASGYVSLHIVKCGLSGPPETGKTCVRALMLDLDAPRERRSTAIATRADQVTPDFMRIYDIKETAKQTSFKWQEVKGKSMARFIANTLVNEDYEYESEEDRSDREESVSYLNQGRYINLLVEIKKLLKEMKKAVKKRKRRGLNGIRLVYFVDVGGQPQFQEILPNFVRCDVNLLVHKLSEKLTDRPAFNYVIDGKRYTVPEEMIESNIDIIEQSVRSISSNMSTGSKPHVALLGTFKDKFDQDHPGPQGNKELMKRSEKISESVKAYVGASGLDKCELITPPHGSKIFAIDASPIGWNSVHTKRAIEDLKSCIHNYADKKEPVKIAIKWFIFLQNLSAFATKNHHRDYLTLAQCHKIGGDSAMNESDVLKALELFDDCNIILYFPEILKNIIFVQPAFLYSKTTDLIVASFNCNKGVLDEDNREFQKSGIFTHSLLKNMKNLKLNDKDFKLKHFLDLLKGLFIIAELHEGRYFMPCVLPSCETTSSERLNAIVLCMQENRIRGPLWLTFTHRKSPRGLFCALLVVLAGNSAWKLSKLSDNTMFRHRNLVEFELCDEANQPSGSVVVVDKKSHLEVYTTCDPSFCADIRKTIQDSFNRACQNMKYNHNDLDFCGLPCTITHNCDGSHSTKVYQDKSSHEWKERCSIFYSSKSISLTSPWFLESVPESKCEYYS